MSNRKRATSEATFRKAEDLKVVFDFAIDNSVDAQQRTEQVREVIAQMILLARKRGRPRRHEEEADDCAA